MENDESFEEHQIKHNYALDWVDNLSAEFCDLFISELLREFKESNDNPL